jgi:TRAP-type C4-dicarboxylate transport system permease small subunit
MRHAFLRLVGGLDRVLGVVTSALLALAACLGLLQVLSRFLFRLPIEWTEVLIRISLAWMVFLGAALVFRTGSMIAVDLMRRLMPARFRRAHETALLVLTLSFLLLLSWMGFAYAQRGSVQTIIGLEFASMFWAYLAVPVGSACAALAAVAAFVEPGEPARDDTLET